MCPSVRLHNTIVVLRRLCEQGDNRNAADERGCTPLHVAAEKGFTRVLERLLKEDEVHVHNPFTLLRITRTNTRVVALFN